LKAVILAGGLGTRITEETVVRPQADGRDRWQADPLAHENSGHLTTVGLPSPSMSQTLVRRLQGESALQGLISVRGHAVPRGIDPEPVFAGPRKLAGLGSRVGLGSGTWAR
jgi:hypothetical protein